MQSVRVGRFLSGLAIAFLVMDAGMKLLKLQVVVEASTRLGYPDSTTINIGILLLTCTVLYAIPRTAVLGAILVTAYLGGATATLVRVGDPFYFPVLVGLVVWGGLYLREPRLRALVPIRS